MAKLNDQTIPDVDELSRLFTLATGDPETLDSRDRKLLLLWEHGIREELLTKTSVPVGEPHRWHLREERQSLTHRFEIINSDGPPLKGYLILGFYPDGRLGEIFLEMAKEGAFTSGIMDALVTCMSIGLQHGIPLESFVKKFKHTKFEPAGYVKGAPHAITGFAGSVLDYLAKYLSYRCPNGQLTTDEDYNRQDHTGEEAEK